MLAAILLLMLSSSELAWGSHHTCTQNCQQPTLPSYFSFSVTVYESQPKYVTFVDDTQKNRKIDNWCITWSPLPDTQTSFMAHYAIVLCDGSLLLKSHLEYQQDVFGPIICANSTCKFLDYILGDVGCDSSLLYRCYPFGDCVSQSKPKTPTFSLSNSCSRPTDTCIETAIDLAKANGIKEPKYYKLPYKYPTQCVTRNYNPNRPLADPQSYSI